MHIITANAKKETFCGMRDVCVRVVGDFKVVFMRYRAIKSYILFAQ